MPSFHLVHNHGSQCLKLDDNIENLIFNNDDGFFEVHVCAFVPIVHIMLSD
jgi:hypothetical protein